MYILVPGQAPVKVEDSTSISDPIDKLSAIILANRDAKNKEALTAATVENNRAMQDQNRYNASVQADFRARTLANNRVNSETVNRIEDNMNIYDAIYRARLTKDYLSNKTTDDYSKSMLSRQYNDVVEENTKNLEAKYGQNNAKAMIAKIETEAGLRSNGTLEYLDKLNADGKFNQVSALIDNPLTYGKDPNGSITDTSFYQLDTVFANNARNVFTAMDSNFATQYLNQSYFDEYKRDEQANANAYLWRH